MYIQDWTSLVFGSLQSMWLGGMSIAANILGALIVLIIGLIVASGLSALVERVVSMVRLDKALQSLGLQEYFSRAGLNLNSGRFFGLYRHLRVLFTFQFLTRSTTLCTERNCRGINYASGGSYW